MEKPSETAGASPDEGVALSQRAAALDRVLEARAQAERDVLAIIDRRLGARIDENAWDAVNGSLIYYLGAEAAELVTWVVQAEQASRIEELEDHASPRVISFLRTIVGLYGTELATAYARWDELPDDWGSVFREVRFEQIRGRHILKIRIDKLNGDQVVLEASPSSMLELTLNMLLTCRLVGTAEGFNPTVLEKLSKEYEEFLKLFAPPEEVGTQGVTSGGAKPT